ncbi:MAG: hypothetical protein AAFR87_19005 [Bacteroidota bacterium]
MTNFSIQGKAFLYSLAILSLTLTSCVGLRFGVPDISYLGESYPEVSELDVFYDEADVEYNFDTMGQLVHDKIIGYTAEQIKSEMILAGKKHGADAIVFYDMYMDRTPDDGWDRLTIRAKLIKYVN